MRFPVWLPMRRIGQLDPESLKPLITEDGFSTLDELPCACVVRSFLYGVVDPAYGDRMRKLVVENCLEG
jgi:hypothetical protein